MRRHPPAQRMEIPVPLQTYHQLLGASSAISYEKEYWEIAVEAVEEWTRRHGPEALPMSAANGYQWKRIFLPHGTLLRTVFGGKNYHCLVEGDQILYNNQAVSPSGFVNAVGGIRRNAWQCTWILFPDTKEWKLADAMRTRARPRRERKPAAAPQQAPGVQPPAPGVPVYAAPSNAEPASAAPASAAPASAAPAPAAPAKAEPANTECAKSPSHAHASPTATSASNPTHAARAIHEEVRCSDANGDERGPRRQNSIQLPSHRSIYGIERRTDGDDPIAQLLRRELLPLLHRLCAFGGAFSERRSAPVS